MKNHRARVQQKIIKTVSALAEQTPSPEIKNRCGEIKEAMARNEERAGREKLKQLIPLLQQQEKGSRKEPGQRVHLAGHFVCHDGES